MTSSIFERYGGFAAIRRIVSSFYDKVLDSSISHHFEGVDMRRLIDHQAKFVTSITGGPASYGDDHLRRVHARLGITDAEFEVMRALFVETVEDFGFSDPDTRAVEHEIVRRRDVIVTRSDRPAASAPR